MEINYRRTRSIKANNSLLQIDRRSAVVMRAWRAFLSSVNFTFIVNFFRAFSLSLIYLLSFFFFPFSFFFLLSIY